MNYFKFIFLFCILDFWAFNFVSAALIDGKLGTVTAGATLKATYDSRVFAISSTEFSERKNNSTAGSSELESEDDFIISFSPTLNFASKFGLIKLSGSAGVNVVQYIINNKKSYVVPTTSFSIDFDDTLALKKRLSNNAKIRFESTFDLGQVVGASVLDQDLVSYTYFTAGFNVRYNHSEKFGLGGGTNYSYRFYQTDQSSDNQPNFDFSTLPITARAFYIYSEKLDFFTNYTFSSTKARKKDANELTSSNSHSISIGADGQFSPKFGGTASIGYSLVDFLNSSTQNQDNIITSLSLKISHNSKTSSNFNVSRSFSPTATGASTFTTSLGYGLNHRFTEDWSGGVNITTGFTDFSSIGPGGNLNQYDMSSYGLGFTTSKILSRYFTLSGGYNFTHAQGSNTDSYNRHVIYSQLSGRF